MDLNSKPFNNSILNLILITNTKLKMDTMSIIYVLFVAKNQKHHTISFFTVPTQIQFGRVTPKLFWMSHRIHWENDYHRTLALKQQSFMLKWSNEIRGSIEIQDNRFEESLKNTTFQLSNKITSSSQPTRNLNMQCALQHCLAPYLLFNINGKVCI